MNKIFIVAAFISYFNTGTLENKAQQATRINPSQMTSATMPSNAKILWVDSDPNIRVTNLNAIKIPYTNVMDTPQLATVARTGNYNDLSNKPSLFSGTYADLAGKPTLFSGAYVDLTGKPALSSVATSGSYNDLSNKPIIPSNTNQLTNGAGFISAEVDGSITNEIELPSQTGQSDKYLTTNGSTVSWAGVTSTTASAYGSATLPLLTVGTNNATVTFNTAMPNTNYSVVVDIQGNATLLGALVYQGTVVSKSTTGVTVQLRNTGLVSLAAGGVVSITAIGIQ